MSSPHVVIDVRMLNHAGIGRYIRNVVPRVMSRRPEWRFTLLTPAGHEPISAWQRAGASIDVRQCRSTIYSIREQIELVVRTPRDASLFWSPHYNVPLFVGVPLVVTIHDVGHLALGAIYGGALQRTYARQMLAGVRRRAASVMFVSRFSQQEFSDRVGPPRQAAVIYPGVERSWRELGNGVSPHARPYLLFVGSVKPHKNLISLIRAFECIRDRRDVDLVIVGARAGQRTVDRAALMHAERVGPRVRFVDDADDDMLQRYLRHAVALVVPSLYEGFGLPAAEAMAVGCPCIVSRAASLPEVCGEAALFFDPMEPTDIARQIERLLDDAELRRSLIDAGWSRAPRYDWEMTSDRTVEALEQALVP